jgi:hypothetical protein
MRLEVGNKEVENIAVPPNSCVKNANFASASVLKDRSVEIRSEPVWQMINDQFF